MRGILYDLLLLVFGLFRRITVALREGELPTTVYVLRVRWRLSSTSASRDDTGLGVRRPRVAGWVLPSSPSQLICGLGMGFRLGERCPLIMGEVVLLEVTYDLISSVLWGSSRRELLLID